jgi:FkbM family methyltransferase
VARKLVVMKSLKRMASRLPPSGQNELKRVLYRLQIRRGSFVSPEPEYAILPHLVKPGDWVVDVGANVGHYTRRLSQLAGKTGRVIAFEPVPETFALLAANLQAASATNATLVNAAVSDTTRLVGMSIPLFDTGLSNYYEAHISEGGNGNLQVLSLSFDDLHIGHRISLIKIDAERHEASVLNGMQRTLASDCPTLIIETNSPEIARQMSALGYAAKKLQGSPNVLFIHSRASHLLSEIH